MSAILKRAESFSAILFMTGMMGSGKTTVGKLLAKKLKWRFKDTDRLIERREKKKISEIFRAKGEAGFRRLEKSVLLSMRGQKKLVLSTGGGLAAQASNRAWMRRNGVTVFLDLPARTILKRLNKLETAKRPLLAQGKSAFLAMAKKRRPLYLKADLKVSALKRPSAVADEILLKIARKSEIVLHDKTAR